MNNVIAANDLRIRGVSVIREVVSSDSEAIISIRGKNKYVVMDMKKYNYLRECELEAALSESRRDLKEGKIIKESVSDHMKRVIGSHGEVY